MLIHSPQLSAGILEVEDRRMFRDIENLGNLPGRLTLRGPQETFALPRREHRHDIRHFHRIAPERLNRIMQVERAK